MTFLDLARRRYATKRYDPSQAIDPDTVEQLKQIMRLCPSSINCQPWKFTFVQDERVKGDLAAVSMHNEHKIRDASLLVVFQVIDDLDVYQRYVDQEMEAHLAEMYNGARQSMPDEQVRAWMKNQVYIALGFCLSACVSLGLDSTPMEGIEPDRYREILSTGHYRPLFAVALGHRAPDDKNDPARTPKVRRNLDDVVEMV